MILIIAFITGFFIGFTVMALLMVFQNKQETTDDLSNDLPDYQEFEDYGNRERNT